MKRKKTKKRITSKAPKLRTRRKKAGRRATKKAIKRASKKGSRKRAKRPAAQFPEISPGRSETTVVYEVIETQAFEEPSLGADYREQDLER